MTLQELTTSVISLLTRAGSNRVSATDILTAVQQVIAYFATQIADIIPDWTSGATFKLDGTGAGKYCKYADTTGKKRIFETKVDNNTNQLPPTDPAVTENAYWREVSASASSALQEWVAGLFGPNLQIVFHNHSVDGRGLYVLLDPVRPFASTNIETEIAAGKWERIGGSSGGGGGGTWGSITGTITDQTDLVTYIAAQISAVIDAAPGALDTLNELAAALGDDPNFASTVTTALAARELTANKDTVNGYVGLSAWSIKFRNLANSFTSLLQNAATAVRTYTFPDKDIVVSGLQDRVIGAAFSNETSPITVGTNKVTFHVPYDVPVIYEIMLELSTPQTSGSTFTVDVNKNGASILSTKITVDNTEQTSITAATPYVLSSSSLTKGDKITIDVDQVGDGTALGGKIYIRG